MKMEKEIIKGIEKANMYKEAKASVALDGRTQVMEKEFNLKKKYTPRKPRKVSCLYCGREYLTKAKIGSCSIKCKEERQSQKQKEYNKKHKRMIANSVRKYAQKNKKKINVKAKTNYHIKISKKQICQFKECKALATEKHHEDYDKPLVVKFYCRKHHGFVHRRMI